MRSFKSWLILFSVFTLIIYILLHVNLLQTVQTLNLKNDSVQLQEHLLQNQSPEPISAVPVSVKKTTTEPTTTAPSTTTETTESATTSETTPAPAQESEFDLYIGTRRLVLLAVRRMNSLLKYYQIISGSTALPCAKWWTDPAQTLRNEITASTPQFEDHLLEFEAESPWDKVLFEVKVRLSKRNANVEFLSNFSRLGSFQRVLHGNEKLSCLTEVQVQAQTALLHESQRSQLDSICSCERRQLKMDAGYADLPSWPKNVSFMVDDYLDYKNLSSLFYLLPKLEGQRSHCGDRLQMLVMVSSAPTHFVHRNTIRATYGARWALDRHEADLVFLFGRVRNDTLQKLLEQEAAAHSDIIQANFEDSYHNLTLSHLSMYSYVLHVCSENVDQPGNFTYHPPKNVLKADDDFVLNVEVALAVAKMNPEAELIGCSYCGTPPIRNTAYMHKYYTPKYMYLGPTYPGYLSGVAYLLRCNVIPRFLEASRTVPMIHMDDVYITGLLPKAMGIYPRLSSLFGYGRVDPLEGCKLTQMGCSYVLTHADMLTQWRALELARNYSTCTPNSVADLTTTPVTDDFKQMCRYV